jgi:hypothetical protein
MSETDVLAELRLEASRLGLALWRNNSGAARDMHGRLLRFGLGNESAALWKIWKSSDLVGVGPGGRLVAIEAKDWGWTWTGNAHERAQWSFMQNVMQLGGIAGFCTCAGDLRRMLCKD